MSKYIYYFIISVLFLILPVLLGILFLQIGGMLEKRLTEKGIVKFKKINGQYIYFRLVDRGTGSIYMAHCDKKGNMVGWGYIICIDRNTGEVYRYTDLNPSIGLSLDSSGKINISGR